jgi:hypothetical protein
MTNELDLKLSQLKSLEDNITKLGNEKEELRKEVFAIIETENLDQYKNEVATVSRVEKKTIKFIKDKEDILAEIENQNLVKYLDIIPEEIIPEHKELNKTFDKDIKEGSFVLEGIEVETKLSPMIRFIN